MHSTTIERTDVLAELDTIYQQWRGGILTSEQYKTAFAEIDRAHSHTLLCANGDHRLAIQIIGGRLLCGVCALLAQEPRA